MKELRYTLLSDGSSDEVLLPILTWLLRENGVRCAIQPAWAELRRLRQPPRKLSDRIKTSIELFPCDLLFVHRDAENAPHAQRVSEINKALVEAAAFTAIPDAVCVIPIRMQEAWLLFDEEVLRRAAGNPYGKIALKLPALMKLEQLPDPKTVLYDFLRAASGLQGRRRKQMLLNKHARRVADLTDDFEPLRALSAFQALEKDLRHVVSVARWNV